MRLTLRTLLAYMDDLLEPQDAIQMGKRIEENKVATELVHRIRTRMRLLRLGAPKVEGKGLGADANSVAEYLDNSLAPERVPDFEKLCLESDVQLAEAASCHQILAAVLDKPAAVDPALRLRVYNLIARADDFGEAAPVVGEPGEYELQNYGHRDYGHQGRDHSDYGHPGIDSQRGDLASPRAATAFGPLGVQDSEIAGLPTVPSAPVAAASRKTRYPLGAVVAATVAVVLLVVLGGLRLAGPFDGRHPLAGLLHRGSPGDDATQLAAATNGSGDSDSDSDSGDSDSGDSGDSGSGDRGIGGEAVNATGNSDGANGSAASVGANGDVNPDGNGQPASAGDGVPADGLAAEVGVPAGAGAAAGAAAGAGEPVLGEPNIAGGAANNVVGGPNGAGNPRPARVAFVPGGGVGDATDEAVAAAGANPAGTNGLPLAGGVVNRSPVGGDSQRDVEGLEMGRLLSEEQLVARRNPDDNLWYRMPRGASIAAGDHLVSLPSFRPQFILSTGVQFMTAGAASLRFGAVAATQTPILEVESGRLLVATSGRPGAEIVVNLAGQAGTLRFIDVDAEVAMEVRREFVAGEDPMVTSAPTTIAIAVRRGKVGWVDPMIGGRSDTIIGSGMVAVFSPGAPLRIEDRPFPAWSSPQPAGGLERSAAEQLLGLVKVERPLTLSLSELTQFRKTEVRSLAARCLAAVGEYQALWKELADERQYSYWDEALDALRLAMVRSAQDALDVRRSAEQLMKQDVPLLTQLLRGFDASQLENGGAAELVEALDHADLEVRVLAFENLRRITGATHNYRPEKPAEARKASVMEWRRQLRDGRIVYRQRAADPE